MKVLIDNKIQQTCHHEKAKRTCLEWEQRSREKAKPGQLSLLYIFRGEISKSDQSSYHCGDRKTRNLESRHQKAILIKYLEVSFVTGAHKAAG